MDKQELLGKIEAEKRGREDSPGVKDGMDFCKFLIKRHLDEPEKPEIPKFVADWIRGFRILDVTDLNIIRLYFRKETEKKCEQWITDNFNDFIKALANGYTEKEPAWVVRINEKLYFCRFTDKYFEENPDEPTYSESGNPEFIKKFTNKDKAEAVATLINGEVEEWGE